MPKPQRTQQTKPKQGEQATIPVPKKEDFDSLIKRAAKPSNTRSPRK